MNVRDFKLNDLKKPTSTISYLADGEYGLALSRFRVATVEILVINKNKEVLLVMRKEDPAKGEWWVCGSKMNGNETIEQTACRTMSKELGLKIDSSRIIDLQKIQFVDWPPSKTAPLGEFNLHNIVVLHITNNEEMKIALEPHEHSKYVWISPDKIRLEKENYLKPLVEMLKFI